MSASRRPDGRLELGGVALMDLLEDASAGTPAYVYDLDAIAREASELHRAFEGAPHVVAYAVKANSAGLILRTLVEAGCGADVVSGAELLLALRCGVTPGHLVYSGVAKTDDELDLAVACEIGALQVESVEEIPRIVARARAAGKMARLSLRINPGVDAEELDTHSYIATGHDDAKFGVPLSSVPDALNFVAASPHVRLAGIAAHVGSQFTTTDAYLASARAAFALTREIRERFDLTFVDCGGGFGIDYTGEGCVRPAEFVRRTRALQAEMGLGSLALYCEPGRSLVGEHGVLLARVIQRKIGGGDDGRRRWTMIDAGMNDLMRPALYQARHRIVPLDLPTGTSSSYRVVGPVCESSDDFGVHELPDGGLAGVAILDAGAYGYSMASRYNGRALPAEIFVQGGSVKAVRPRKSMEDWVSDRLGP